MDPRPLRALSRELVRELGMLSQQCGSLALSPLEAHLLIELENGPATNQQLAAIQSRQRAHGAIDVGVKTVLGRLGNRARVRVSDGGRHS